MSLSSYITEDILSRLRADENSIEAGKVGDLWFPHMDSEGKPTLGFGHLLEDKKYKKGVSAIPKYSLTIDGVKYNTVDGVPTAAINKLFSRDVATKDKETKALIKDTTTNLAAQQSIFEMSYQMGVHKVKKFKNMLSAMKSGRWEEAATEVLTNSKGGKSLFATQTPKRANRLADRIRLAGASTKAAPKPVVEDVQEPSEVEPTASMPEDKAPETAPESRIQLSPNKLAIVDRIRQERALKVASVRAEGEEAERMKLSPRKQAIVDRMIAEREGTVANTAINREAGRTVEGMAGREERMQEVFDRGNEDDAIRDLF